MLQPVISVDHSQVREGKLDELKKGMSELAQFVEANEPQLIAYHVYFNEDDGAITAAVLRTLETQRFCPRNRRSIWVSSSIVN